MRATPPEIIGKQRWVPLFFGVGACAWVPHWACHYYRLETGSAFTIGNWYFSKTDSAVALVVYGVLILANLLSTVAPRVRVAVASVSGALHLLFAALHFYRFLYPFRFEVFGYPWSLSASFREAVLLSGFGILSLTVAAKLRGGEPGS